MITKEILFRSSWPLKLPRNRKHSKKLLLRRMLQAKTKAKMKNQEVKDRSSHQLRRLNQWI